jgi:ribonuclease HII
VLKAYHTKGLTEAGCDEAGRGCLAGPVVAAAVILPLKFNHPWLNDSKQLTEKQRDTLRPVIEKEALAWAVASVLPKEIDEINILNASFLAMHRALEQINLPIDLILVDGNRFKPFGNTAHKCIIKGDGIYRSIAAASVLAKTHRDEVMLQLHYEYPHYAWNKNKGYPTKLHRDAIRINGSCIEHRMSFTLLPEQLEIDFGKK